MGKLEELLALAKSQVGYTEKDNDKDLDSKVGSTAGSGNHTKYARDLNNIGLSGYCGSAWCAVYQMWLEVQTVGKAQALKNMGSQFYNCFAVRNHAKSQRRWLERSGTPAAGDLVIFSQSHIARVIKVTKTMIYTNEGNTNNGTAVVRNGGMVCDKSYSRSNSSILGYVQMGYAEMEEAVKLDLSVNLPSLVKGSRSGYVKTLQQLLAARGYQTNGIDGIFGSGTEAAVKQFQDASDVRVNYPGTVGAKTWVALLKG